MMRMWSLKFQALERRTLNFAGESSPEVEALARRSLMERNEQRPTVAQFDGLQIDGLHNSAK